MPKVSDIDAVSISLKANDEQSLFVLLAADGTINRLGTGVVDNSEKEMFIGVTKDPLFQELLTCFEEELLDHMGGYDAADKLGVPCQLTVCLSFTNADDNGFSFRYGSESQGPPPEICDIVTAAVTVTDPWYEEQKEMVGKSDGS